MLVRQAKPDDVKDLANSYSLLEDYLAGTNPLLWRDPERIDAAGSMFQEYLRSDSAVVFVAEEDGELIGYMAGRVKDSGGASDSSRRFARQIRGPANCAAGSTSSIESDALALTLCHPERSEESLGAS